MPVDFIIYNWHISPTGAVYNWFRVGEEPEHEYYKKQIVEEINIIDKDLAEVKFDKGKFVVVRNINQYGTMLPEEQIKIEEDERSAR